MDGTRQRKEVYGEKKEKKNKVEEIQIANLARSSQAIKQKKFSELTLRLSEASQATTITMTKSRVIDEQ